MYCVALREAKRAPWESTDRTNGSLGTNLGIAVRIEVTKRQRIVRFAVGAKRRNESLWKPAYAVVVIRREVRGRQHRRVSACGIYTVNGIGRLCQHRQPVKITPALAHAHRHVRCQ